MGFLMITGVLWFRLLWLQVFHPSHWVTLARRQHLQVVELLPTRGTILDRHLKPLALSIRLSSVFADPRHVKNPEQAARYLAPLLHRPETELEQKLSRKANGFVWLARKISNQAATQVRALRIPGIDFMMEPMRVYPHGYLASHVVGFAGLDAEGLEGIELAYDRYLKGEPGWRWLSRDARRRPVGAWETPFVSPRDGVDVVLTLDTTIQFIAEQALEQAYQKWHVKGAVAIVMDPMTGVILGLSNRPTFDPNQFAKAAPETLRDRAITDTFEPGSVFKIVTASVALAKGSVRLDETFNCENGSAFLGGHILHDYRPHGMLTFRDVIAQSSNIGTVKVAMRLGPGPVYEGMQAFGFGKPTGIELLGEVAGTVKPPSQWSKPSITAIPIGQEVTVTALQLAQAMSVIANGGYLVKPRIVREIRHPSGTLIKAAEPVTARQILSPDVARQMKEILSAVVGQGTGKLAAIPGVSAAGKTGTAQKVEPSGTYSSSRCMASFVGFAPLETPRLTVAIVMDEPQPLHTGGAVAAPVFKEIATQVLSYLKVEEGAAVVTAMNRE